MSTSSDLFIPRLILQRFLSLSNRKIY
jgi:hypothetical protein